jgi:hypothetical protein
MNEDLITSLGLPKTKPSFSNPSDVIKVIPFLKSSMVAVLVFMVVVFI